MPNQQNGSGPTNFLFFYMLVEKLLPLNRTTLTSSHVTCRLSRRYPHVTVTVNSYGRCGWFVVLLLFFRVHVLPLHLTVSRSHRQDKE